MPPTILITRPEPASHEFADQLRARLGCAVCIVLSPVMRIAPVGDLPDLIPVRTLIFTSRNGVAAYADKTDRRDIYCYCVGDATADKAISLGMTAISASGSADDLVARLLADGIKDPCLHIRGEHVTGDLTGQLRAAGVQADEVVLYRQVRQPLTPEAQKLLNGDDPVILPLFSPRTARIVFTSTISAPILGVALSENVANDVPEAFAGSFVVADRPDAPAMVAAIAGLMASAKSLEGGKRAQ